MMKSIHPSLMLASAAVMFSVASAAPLANNPGFETEDTAPNISANWTIFASGAPGTVSERSNLAPFAGSWAQSLTAIGAPGAGATAGIIQNSALNSALPSLQPGSTLTLSFRGNYTLGPGGVGFFNLRILNSAGGIVANTGLGVITASTSGYQQYTSATLTVPPFGEPPNDFYAAFVEINVAAGAFTGSTAQGFIDEVDINGTVISAPPAGCSLADITGIGGPPATADGILTGDDFNAFIGAFAASDLLADITGIGGPPATADGIITGDDFNAFIAAFAEGCP